MVPLIITAVKIDGGEHICLHLLHLLPSFFPSYCFTLGECFINQAGGLCWWGGEKPSFGPLLVWEGKQSQAVNMDVGSAGAVWVFAGT